MPYAPSMRRLFLIAVLLTPSCARPADTARVIGVSDGDTGAGTATSPTGN